MEVGSDLFNVLFPIGPVKGRFRALERFIMVGAENEPEGFTFRADSDRRLSWPDNDYLDREQAGQRQGIKFIGPGAWGA